VKAVLVDSNVLLDVVTNDTRWSNWSRLSLEQAAVDGPLLINPIIYAEVSIGFDRIEDLDDALTTELFQRVPLPYEAGFLAGKAFVQYRKRGGKRERPLPDFYIGAHAAVAGVALLTRDAQRYRTYFPTLELITPAAL
jgi:predicted nucleic acid-binding protein